jgi:hypothetical protein
MSMLAMKDSTQIYVTGQLSAMDQVGSGGSSPVVK